MPIVLTMASYKDLEDQKIGLMFFGALEAAGGIYVPEILELAKKVDYRSADLRSKSSAWESNVVLLKRKAPVEVTTTLTKLDKSSLKVLPNTLYIGVDQSYFSSSKQLREYVELGHAVYDVLSPVYGYVTLPWLPDVSGISMPHLGLPGWGWATWLGPEYDDLVRLQAVDVEQRRMTDSGRCILLPIPERVDKVDTRCLRAYESVLRSLDPKLFQQRSTREVSGPSEMEFDSELIAVLRELAALHATPRNPRVPRFRYRDS